MPRAINNDAVRKSLACVDSSFSTLNSISVEPFMKLKERKAHRFSIANSQTKNSSSGDEFTSSGFHVGGSIWYISYYPKGSPNSNDRCISLFLSKMKPSNATRTASMLDDVALFTFHLQDRSGKCVISDSLMYIFRESPSWGWSRFTTRAYLEDNCVQNDNIVFVCELAIYEILDRAEPSTSRSLPSTSRSLPVTQSPPQIHSLLAAMLERKEMTDVVFQVGEEMIPAHRLVLAARSPVFRAQLYGPMSDSTMDCIPIDDLKASVFKAMLHYIYTDSLPENATLSLAQSDNQLDESSIAEINL